MVSRLKEHKLKPTFLLKTATDFSFLTYFLDCRLTYPKSIFYMKKAIMISNKILKIIKKPHFRIIYMPGVNNRKKHQIFRYLHRQAFHYDNFNDLSAFFP